MFNPKTMAAVSSLTLAAVVFSALAGRAYHSRHLEEQSQGRSGAWDADTPQRQAARAAAEKIFRKARELSASGLPRWEQERELHEEALAASAEFRRITATGHRKPFNLDGV